MRFKKWTTILLVMLMVVTMMTGCSKVERDFYELFVQFGDLSVFRVNGSIELDLEELPQNPANEVPPGVDKVIKQVLNNTRIDYQGSADYNLGYMSYRYTLVDKSTGEETPLTTVFFKGSKIYINIKEIVGLIKEYSSEEERQELDRIFGDVEYISLDAQDLEDYMDLPPGSPSPWKNDMMRESKSQFRVVTGLYNSLIYQAYDKYQSGLISKDGNKYTMTLNLSEFDDVSRSFMLYSVNNIYKIGTIVKTHMKNLSDTELASLGISPSQRETSLEEIDRMIDDVNNNRSEVLKSIDEYLNSPGNELDIEFNDSKIVYSLEKVNNSYETSCKIKLNISGKTDSERMNVTLNIKETNETGGVIDQYEPANATPYKEIKKRLPVNLSINVDEKTYNLKKYVPLGNNQYIDLRIVKGISYLPLRKTGKLLGLKVGWDNGRNLGYVEYNGVQDYVNGQMINGTLYIKAKDFEKYGFNVNWDGDSRTIDITR